MTTNLSSSDEQASGHHSRKAHIEASWAEAMLSVAIEDIQHLERSQVTAVQSVLQHGDEFGYWRTPKEWRPDASLALLHVDLRKRIVEHLPEDLQKLIGPEPGTSGELKRMSENNVTFFPESSTELGIALDDAVLSLTRYLVLLRMGPAGLPIRRRKAPLDPSTINNRAYAYLSPMAALGVANRISAVGKFGNLRPLSAGCFSHIDMKAIGTLSDSTQKQALIEIGRMQMLNERGYWSDMPALDVDAPNTPTTAVSGEASVPAPEESTKPHLPLPDDYIADMGSRSLWLMQQLAPNLLEISKEIRSIWTNTESLPWGAQRIGVLRSEYLESYLRDYQWVNSEGNPLGSPPFKLHLPMLGKRRIKEDGADSSSSRMPDWPPRYFSDIMALAHNVQLAHMFVVTLSLGARKSEVLDLKRSCIQHAVDGLLYAEGRTFKLVESYEGTWRDWVLPDVAAEALEQQVRLVTAFEAIGTKYPGKGSAASESATHMWGQLSAAPANDRCAPLTNITQALTAYAKVLGMDTEPGGQKILTHRLRKSLARLVALALTQAPKILMSVFGHKSIEMTLYYILADKDLQAEVEKVGRELRVMRSKAVIEKMVASEEMNAPNLSLGGYGGPAALMVRRSIDTQKERLFRHGGEWGAANAQELAEILTLQGKAWEYVRPGVVCTKFPGTEAGPCNLSRGHPEPASCHTGCNHRLEEAFLREDVDGSIRDALASYKDAGAAGEELVQALWAGQVRSHIVRFPDLQEKWMAVPEVRELIEA